MTESCSVSQQSSTRRVAGYGNTPIAVIRVGVGFPLRRLSLAVRHGSLEDSSGW